MPSDYTADRGIASAKLQPTVAKPLFWLLLVAVSGLALWARIDDLGFIEESLWYDDGITFINQSYDVGIRSLWMPHVGYQFLYQRIVALIASHLPLAATPYIFSFAWLLSFFSVLYVLQIRGTLAGLDGRLLIYLVAAISLQPNHGEAFFNLGHAHFFLGIALAFHVCIPSHRSLSALELLILVLACLSGPFSTFMIPVLALQLAIMRDFPKRKSTYLIVAACGLIQSWFMFASRMWKNPEDTDATYWLHAISSFVFFGEGSRLTYLAASAFWIIVFVYLFNRIRECRSQFNSFLSLSPVFATVTAALLFFVGVLRFGDAFPNALGPTDMGSRYFLVPYSLMFFAALSCTREQRTAQTAAIALLSLICAATFQTVDRADRASSSGLLAHADMQWTAYARLQQIEPDILIPINAPLPIYPPLHVKLNRRGTVDDRAIDMAQAISVSPPLFASPDGSAQSNGASGNATLQEKSPVFYVDVKNRCESSVYLALQVDAWRSRMGWATVRWGQQDSFDSKRSLSRFYPAGNTVMQFAFRRLVSDHLIRLDLAEGVADSAVVDAVNTLRSFLPTGTTVAVPTKPGGEVRIESVRLRCLGS